MSLANFGESVRRESAIYTSLSFWFLTLKLRRNGQKEIHYGIMQFLLCFLPEQEIF